MFIKLGIKRKNFKTVCVALKFSGSYLLGNIFQLLYLWCNHVTTMPSGENSTNGRFYFTKFVV